MPNPRDDRGIRVDYSRTVTEKPLKAGKHRGLQCPAGFYLYVQVMAPHMGGGPKLRWEPITTMRFHREKDARLAAAALAAAGLDSKYRLTKAGFEKVFRTAYEALQW